MGGRATDCEGIAMIGHSQAPRPPAQGGGGGCINYACGAKPIDGWVNVDLFDASFKSGVSAEAQSKLSSVIQIDLLAPHPFADHAFQFAFCEDFVEHLDQREAILFLTEVRRTLKPGGVLRIATPGLEGVMRRHFNRVGRTEAYAEADGAFLAWGHKHFFCHKSLAIIGQFIGFGVYRGCAYGRSEHSALRDRETRSDQADLNIYAELS
jgi:SAM-dependent methyltransferase